MIKFTFCMRVSVRIFSLPLPLLFLLCVLLPLSALALSERQRQLIAERIAPVGEACLATDPCAAEVHVPRVSGELRSGQKIYETSCFACHQTGVSQAPRLGSPEDWKSVLAQNMSMLYEHALNGLNAMPPRGACVDCSDDEIRAAVDYMVEAVR